MIVRKLPEPVVAALKQRARLHHRSLQGEVRTILEQAARGTPPEGGFAPLDLVLSRTRSQRRWRREDYYDDRGR